MHSLRRPASSFVCNACRSALAQSSTSVTRTNGLRLRSVVEALIPPSRTSQRALSTTTLRRSDKHDPAVKDPQFTFLEDHTATPTETSVEPTSAEPSPPREPAIPWYLQQQTSVPNPIQQAAVIPDLPPNPPPLLETLLEYVSETAGLDDLQLLDLRHLDPPPALGPKLIMIIATARSEKHLHVAADRFCRYLRREHGLKANAAGLLGRNELKIKLRRKAKRMRMLANVGGAVPEGNIDDGIRTGWICCTIGKIEAHPEDTHMPGDNVEEFIGFRDVKPGVNVVVQMFTEEKRIETDLETLWGGVLKTHQRKDKSADEVLKELEQDIEELEDDVEDDQTRERRSTEAITKPPSQDLNAPTPRQQFHRPRSSIGDVFPPASNPGTSRQLRRLHTLGLR